MPGPAMRRLVVTRAELAELSMKGMQEVRMTCIIGVCVSKDCTNHPVWNKAGFIHTLNMNSNGERQIVEDRTDRAEHQDEPEDTSCVPPPRRRDVFLVDRIGRNGRLKEL
jgi:hypothetical protein